MTADTSSQQQDRPRHTVAASAHDLRLASDRLLLREMSEGDFDAVHAYRSDQAVALLTGFAAETPEQTRAFLATVIASQRETPRSVFVLAAEEARSPSGTAATVIGNGTLRVRNAMLREADIAFVLHRDAWGKGLGTEIAESLLRFGFEDLSLHRIYAMCRPENVASARVLEKIGMRKEGHCRSDVFKDGRWWDTLLFAVLDDEWAAAAAQATGLADYNR